MASFGQSIHCKMLLVFRENIRHLIIPNIRGEQTHDSMTVKQWISALKLSDMWGFDKAKTLAVKKLQASKAVDDPIQKWLLGERYNVSAWTIDGCLKLVMRNEDGPQLDEIEKLGLHKALLVYKLREKWFKTIINTLCRRLPDDRMRLNMREEVERALEGQVSEDGAIVEQLELNLD